MSFIILSTGRAGSGYISKLLTEAGIPTGHEVSYNLSGYRGKEFEGESSWLALPYVEEGIYPPDCTFYHQVRNPLYVIGSLINGEMQKYKEYLDFQEQYLPRNDDEDYLEYCARFVYEWNNRIEKITSIRWRVEDVDMNTLQTIAFSSGLKLDRDKATIALLGVSKKTNKHPNTKMVKLKDISDPVLRANLKDQAERYGYNL